MRLCCEKTSYFYPHLSAIPTSVLLYRGVFLFLSQTSSSMSLTPHCMLVFWPGQVFLSFVPTLYSHFENRSYSIWSNVSHNCQFFKSFFHLSDQPLPTAIPLQLLSYTSVHSSTSAQTEKASIACSPSHPD